MLTVLHPIFIHHHSRLRAVVCPDQAAFRVALEKTVDLQTNTIHPL